MRLLNFAVFTALTFSVSASAAATPVVQSADASVRTWTDRTGRFHTEASLLDGNATVIRLHKLHGSVITVPVARLSKTDQQFVAESLRLPQYVGQASQPERYTVRRPTLPDDGLPTAAKKPATENTSGWLAELQSSWSALAIPTGNAGVMASTARLFTEPVPAMPANLVYIRLSSSFLQRVVNEPFARSGQINDVVLGSQVGGISHTTGVTRVVLQPSEHDGQAVIQLFGTTHYDSIADAGPIQVFTSGITQFASAKALRIDSQGVQVGVAVTNAQTSSTVTGVTTTLPRLLGRIALRIGGRRAQESRAEAAEITSQHTAGRINRQFDSSASEQITELCRSLGGQLVALPADHLIRQCSWQASSSPDALQLVMLAPADKYAAIPAPAVTNPDAEIEVHVHAALMRFALTDRDLQKLLRPVTVRMASLRKAAGSASALGQPEVRWSADRNWLSLTWPNPAKPKPAPPPQAPVVASR